MIVLVFLFRIWNEPKLLRNNLTNWKKFLDDNKCNNLEAGLQVTYQKMLGMSIKFIIRQKDSPRLLGYIISQN